MAKKKKVEEPKPRIYVILPDTVDIPQKGHGSTTSPPKIIHVELKDKFTYYGHALVLVGLNVEVEEKYGIDPIPITILSVRNSKELAKVFEELEESVVVESFYDHNKELYGTDDEVLTAVATHPCLPQDVDLALNHLPPLEMY